VTRVLALDVGTSSARARLYDERGEPAGDEAQHGYDNGNDPSALVDVVRRAIAEAGCAFDAVGASCFGHSLLAVDGRGRPLTPLLDWRDTRSAPAAEALAARLDPGEVHRRTGCHLHTSYWPAKLAWLAHERPAVFRSARRFVSFAEFLYGELRGGDAPMSLSSASATGLLDLSTRTWDAELLEALELDPARLPEVSDEPVGSWYPALLDGACSNLGVGCRTRGRATLMVGTSAAYRVLYEAGDGVRPRRGLFLYRVAGAQVLEGGALSDGGNLHQWLERTLAPSDGSVAERPPDAHGLAFLTLLGGERSPGWRLRAEGAIAGLTFATTPLDLRQAALEGVAYRFAEVADLLPGVEDVVCTGGGLVSSPDWCQVLADVLERPVSLSPVDEASLRGAAVATLERLGERPDEPAAGRVFEPRLDRAEAHRAARERVRRLYEAAT
jgi:gluconokinase